MALSNMPRRSFCRTLSFGVLVLLFCSVSMACTCRQRSTAYYYELANLVVRGKVVSTNEEDMDAAHKAGKSYVRRVSVRVEEVFKGDALRTLMIENNGSSCSMFMQKDDQVILFFDKTMFTDSCNGSLYLANDEKLRKHFKLDDQSILKYQALTTDRLAELRKAKPRNWWEFWRE